MPRSLHGGRHELGQNFLIHTPSLDRIDTLVRGTLGSILEIGAGDGALTRRLAATGRPLTAIDIDEHRTRRLARFLPGVTVRQADALRHPVRDPVIVGNVPFHLTTPILRRLLGEPRWTDAVLVTQWEVARKRAGVGGQTMMTAQSGPWFTFALHGRIPRSGFTPAPSVDGGILTITRRSDPMLPARARRSYERFVAAVFSGRGRSLDQIVAGAARIDRRIARLALAHAGVEPRALPRDLTASQWAALWTALPRSGRGAD
ncbi:23S ribosomal RNA methyltransferase Erm [Microbacterium sp. ET2]|uniref:23S ribosomal RNA methyltransferase Erm n=1 Tax=Microbacterium albipurpureum TaxID=3050384 RepID=UPI00259D0C60|nr:23S ribosomal RNA methyltransferase Erm [Microbacterium sp. ET2 (Ac-2212)]WJL96519.1 23S ribosomal RNA methyltransferase Erm [Microbacterium sp. ET2 (Ac-2212)]